MRPFLCFLATPSIDKGTIAEIDKVLSRWLDKYHLGRLALLLECMDPIRESILLWAVFKARLDDLMWLHERRHLLNLVESSQFDGLPQLQRHDISTSSHDSAVHKLALGVFAVVSHFDIRDEWFDNDSNGEIALGGNLALLEFLLPLLLRRSDLLNCSVGVAASKGHDTLARWLHDHLLQHNLPVKVDRSAIQVAASLGHLSGLQLLFELWNPVLADVLCEDGLFWATAHRQKAVAAWLAPQVWQFQLVRIFLENDLDGNVLHDVVDPDSAIDTTFMASTVPQWTFPKVQRVFNVFTRLQLGAPLRIQALKACLWEAVAHGMVDTSKWLADALDPDDVKEVVYTKPFYRRQNALFCGFERGGVPLLEYFAARGVHLTPPEMDDLLCSALCQASHKSLVPMWLSGDQGQSTGSRTFEACLWLVKRRNGRVAVMGNLIVRLSPLAHKTELFQALYNEWLSLIQDEAEKSSIQVQCLTKGHVAMVAHILTTSPKLLVQFAKSAPAIAVGSLHATTARAVPMEEFRAIECEALLAAVEADRCDVVRLMMQKMKGIHDDAIAEARAMALCRGQPSLASLSE
ncbi:Aste57867_24141 [Aphanomyces stellatus]|uniref:Aste57867_24141 protein n=1 Tax=Aphanomyces stellatus TaxID=120398 RepID=A0A485KBF0_9STRA|nr:hypothetical protein As57867_024067 [Aphanomyces stellatus]KAF0715286.1 hypothetical protein As57867_003444 [Aphanomyces stellatus]KAF0715296.1 hypothetical protein As57867_003454 [Aphanomyces stellatus]VFT80620.1 Aste57867_3454 [Aphanomyces stellatus]VFT80630.1 Aste57867_3464 [Aphanomyces stellatus]